MYRQYKYFRHFLLLVFCISAGWTRVSAQEEVVSIETNLIRVPVVAFERNGRLVGNLDKENFQIFENGILQKISYFENVDSPFTVMILADVSGSMDGNKQRMGRAIDTFIRMLRPTDTVIVALFDNKELDIKVGPTVRAQYSPPSVAKDKSGLAPWTITFDAVDQAIKYMSKLRGRRAIVLFGDAEPFGMKATALGNLRDAEESEATFYTIRYGSYPTACVLADAFMIQSETWGARGNSVEEIVSKADINSVGRSRQTCSFRKNEVPTLIENVKSHFRGLSERTAGRWYEVGKVDDIDQAFNQIIADLGQQYTLAYEPTEGGQDGERRKIMVKVNIPNVAVRSRSEVVFKKSSK